MSVLRDDVAARRMRIDALETELDQLRTIDAPPPPPPPPRIGFMPPKRTGVQVFVASIAVFVIGVILVPFTDAGAACIAVSLGGLLTGGILM
ncbi:MAG: hypothetical protein QM831_04250 [Kofleriaceae bacterium]